MVDDELDGAEMKIGDLGRPINAVAHDWIAACGEVDADLMLAASQEGDAEEGLLVRRMRSTARGGAIAAYRCALPRRVAGARV